MLTDEMRQSWADDGFFIERQLLSQDLVAKIEGEVIDRIRSDPPSNHIGEMVYQSGPNYLIYPESEPSLSAEKAEDFISKVFNCHAEGVTRAAAEAPEIANIVAGLLGPDIDCFQSQFIFKNPDVIGQPWHQDSYYFLFDQQPQIGVWIALSDATIENGCLWVLPGSHKGPIHDHIPDQRPAANRGYLEIVDQDTSSESPVLMKAGDVLFFHSFLMHKSTDNVSTDRRAAMVLHYGRAGTKPLSEEQGKALAFVNRWIPVKRDAA